MPDHNHARYTGTCYEPPADVRPLKRRFISRRSWLKHRMNIAKAAAIAFTVVMVVGLLLALRSIP